MNRSSAAPAPSERRPAGGSVRLHAVLVTYERPAALERYLEVIEASRIARLVVVDNSSHARARNRQLVDAAISRGLPAELVVTGDNLGPAGGIARGVEKVTEAASGGDWVVLLDDDDPPATPEIFEHLLLHALDGLQRNAGLGGVGLAGARYNRRTGLLVRVEDRELVGDVTVDYCGGGQLPCYRLEALERAGMPDPELFFGFDDLALGLQLERAGFSLHCDGETWLRRRVAGGRAGLPTRLTNSEPTPAWRRYYSVRNAIVIAREHGNVFAPFIVTLTAGVLGPVRDRLVRHDRTVLGPSLHGVVDGWRRRLGRTWQPGDPAAPRSSG